ncbi:OSJNBa0079C19.6 protein, related [Eimeria brunetti]|uniref:OSJNBa0079C19.6 protein, related n=1 Tax=Eimeria brunetti TaxID=51314 RepID=U6LGY5_9EIME|nr:OSJNBa0079C19.6 protein, related [Eimeria brunetti]
MWCGATRLAGDFLVGPVPYDLVVGLDWLTNHRVAWYFQSDKLRTYVNGQWCDLPVVRANDVTQRNGSTQGTRQRTPAEQAYDILAKQVADMTREEATALLRPPSKYKPPSKGKRKAVVAALIQQATESTACISHPLQGLYVILALPAMESNVALRLVEEWQGALCCAMVETTPPNPHQQCLKALPASALPDDEETSPWPTAKLEDSQFDTWLTSVEAQATPRAVLDVEAPYEVSDLRMTPEQLQFHKQEIAKLSANGWIGPTYSPICAPTIMVDKRSDGTGERKMRMVVNYRELNALTIAPDFPLPPIQTILEMLGGAQYFSTLDLESGFHQIRMAKEDRWKTAFRSVMGLYEYKVMPCGLKGAPATFQVNINAYLQPLLGQGVITYLDDVLIYSPDLPSHVTLLQQVLRIFLDQQFYPKFSKCKFAERELTFLGYTAMTPTQQKYSIYDQELLALVSALDKWAHLLRPTKVTAHTDHQALTHLQQLKASKPLRGRTARRLDFLAEFPDLTITYLPASLITLPLPSRVKLFNWSSNIVVIPSVLFCPT